MEYISWYVLCVLRIMFRIDLLKLKHFIIIIFG